jgi:hypothetical protein
MQGMKKSYNSFHKWVLICLNGPKILPKRNLKQEVQGHTNEFSWNLTKLVLWIYLWGGNIVQKVLDIIF